MLIFFYTVLNTLKKYILGIKMYPQNHGLQDRALLLPLIRAWIRLVRNQHKETRAKRAMFTTGTVSSPIDCVCKSYRWTRCTRRVHESRQKWSYLGLWLPYGFLLSNHLTATSSAKLILFDRHHVQNSYWAFATCPPVGLSESLRSCSDTQTVQRRRRRFRPEVDDPWWT
jgi:hypothetical protein